MGREACGFRRPCADAAAAHTDKSDETSREGETVMAEDENRDAVAIAEDVQHFLRFGSTPSREPPSVSADGRIRRG